MEQSDTISELAKALCKVQKERLFALTTSENPFFKSKYADLSSVWEVARGPLTQNGLAVAQTMDTADDGTPVIVTTLLHESGEWLRGRLRLKPVKDDPQSVGSAITYARRYSLSAMLGIAQEDDDAEGAMGKRNKSKSSREAKPSGIKPMTEPQRKKLWAMMKEKEMSTEEAKRFFKYGLGESPTSQMASEMIEHFDRVFEKFIEAQEPQWGPPEE